jgi:hypothetical protein
MTFDELQRVAVQDLHARVRTAVENRIRLMNNAADFGTNLSKQERYKRYNTDMRDVMRDHLAGFLTEAEGARAFMTADPTRAPLTEAAAQELKRKREEEK